MLCTCLLETRITFNCTHVADKAPIPESVSRSRLKHKSLATTHPLLCAAWFWCSSHKSKSHSKQQNILGFFPFPFLVPAKDGQRSGASATSPLKLIPIHCVDWCRGGLKVLGGGGGVQGFCWRIAALSRWTDPKEPKDLQDMRGENWQSSRVKKSCVTAAAPLVRILGFHLAHKSTMNILSAWIGIQK